MILRTQNDWRMRGRGAKIPDFDTLCGPAMIRIGWRPCFRASRIWAAMVMFRRYVGSAERLLDIFADRPRESRGIWRVVASGQRPPPLWLYAVCGVSASTQLDEVLAGAESDGLRPPGPSGTSPCATFGTPCVP